MTATASGAHVDAVRAAADADLEVSRVGEPAELDALRELMREVWGAEVVPPRNLLRGIALSGGSLLVASRGDRPVGFALGWLGWSNGVHFHSHQTGVLDVERSTGVGYALKLVQRADCLGNGVTEMRWTFDPLLLSNATFNLHRLGATVTEYYPNCYGDRVDLFNTGDVTDRIKVAWQLDRPVGGEPVDAAFSAPRLITQDPLPSRNNVEPSAGALVAIPKHYQRLRTEEPSLAAKWRSAMGAALADTFAAGFGIVGMSETAYVVG